VLLLWVITIIVKPLVTIMPSGLSVHCLAKYDVIIVKITRIVLMNIYLFC